MPDIAMQKLLDAIKQHFQTTVEFSFDLQIKETGLEKVFICYLPERKRNVIVQFFKRRTTTGKIRLWVQCLGDRRISEVVVEESIDS